MLKQSANMNDSRKSNFKDAIIKQLEELKPDWPHLYECIDFTRISEASCVLMNSLASRSFDFDSSSKGGRGDFYRSVQQNPLVRSVGISRLFELVSPGQDLRNLSPQHNILDVLGGDGVLARAMKQVLAPSSLPEILVSDLSEDMVAAARRYGLFALRQAAQNLLFKDDTLDGVIIAYGTHHIPKDQRLQTCQEAYRVLKPGGRIVLHDFAVDSPMTHWFKDVVDRYSLTGHSFPHFTDIEIVEYLSSAGFENVCTQYMYDPFILYADSAKEAEQQITEYVLYMYGLTKLIDDLGYEKSIEFLYTLMCKYFKYSYPDLGLQESFGLSRVKILKKANRWCAEVPRVALVGYAVKHFEK